MSSEFPRGVWFSLKSVVFRELCLTVTIGLVLYFLYKSYNFVLRFVFILCVSVFCLHGMSVYHIYAVSLKARRVLDPPETRITVMTCSVLLGSNPGPLGEQSVLLA